MNQKIRVYETCLVNDVDFNYQPQGGYTPGSITIDGWKIHENP